MAKCCIFATRTLSSSISRFSRSSFCAPLLSVVYTAVDVMRLSLVLLAGFTLVMCGALVTASSTVARISDSTDGGQSRDGGQATASSHMYVQSVCDVTVQSSSFYVLGIFLTHISALMRCIPDENGTKPDRPWLRLSLIEHAHLPLSGIKVRFPILLSVSSAAGGHEKSKHSASVLTP